MPTRATKRGAQRTPIDRDCDVLICGASFAGLAIARELAGSGADVMIVDRYEIGERQTSACGIPTGWLEAMGLTEALQQTFGELVDAHPPRRPFATTFRGRSRRSTTGRCAGCSPIRARLQFETAKVESRVGDVVVTDRGEVRAPLIVDALGWRRVLGLGANVQPPDALLSRGLEVHPFGGGEDLEIWIDRSYVPAGYGWSFPADGEVRIGVGSFDPRFHVKEPTNRLAHDLARRHRPLPGQLDPARAAPRHRGRGLLRRRLRRPLPAADRRGDPHGAVLRDRLRTRAARRDRGRPPRVAGAGQLPPVLGRTRLAVSVDAARAAAGPEDRAAAAGARAARDGGQAVRRLVVQPLSEHRAPVVRAGARRAGALTPDRGGRLAGA